MTKAKKRKSETNQSSSNNNKKRHRKKSTKLSGSSSSCTSTNYNIETIDAKEKSTAPTSRLDVQLLNNEKRTDIIDSSSLTLASRLKRQRGTAASTPLPPEWSKIQQYTTNQTFIPRYLSPSNDKYDDDAATNNKSNINNHDEYTSCLEECYKGFLSEQPEEIPAELHASFQYAFDTLYNNGLFLYDVVQPGGKKLSQTFVTRTLIGAPGSTYKYLGLRLFSHPWVEFDKDELTLNKSNSSNTKTTTTTTTTQKSCNTDTSKNIIKLQSLGYSKSCAKALLDIGQINQQLIHRTNQLLKSKIAPTIPNGLTGSAQYSLTLINRMEPTTVKTNLKEDKIHGLGKASVSWHKDSGLQDFSSIAVYHTIQQDYNNQTNKNIMTSSSATTTSTNTTKEKPWKVALRIADKSSQTPALSVPLPSGSLYYLLDDFNHQHEHAVISGTDGLRYSSTHRVAREGRGTWQYIRDKCVLVLSLPLCVNILDEQGGGPNSDLLSCYKHLQKKQLVKDVRSCQQLMTELEFEWIQQWYIQGKLHAQLHPYWHEPIKLMEQSFQRLQRVSDEIIKCMKKKSHGLDENLFDVMIEAVEERTKLRDAWKQRLKDSVFKKLSKELRPFACPITEANRQVKQVSVLDLRRYRSSFVELSSSDPSQNDRQAKTKAKKKTSMTKKEQRKVASNWERMKAKMGK